MDFKISSRIFYDGYAPMDMFLPTMDMLLPSGYAVMDMFFLNCGYASTRISYDGYAPINMLLPPMDTSQTVDMLLPRTGFLILWGKT